MKRNEPIRVAVAESSVIIRSGLSLVLKRLPDWKIQLVEVSSFEALTDCLKTQDLDVLIINPAFGGYFDIERFREKNGGKRIQIVALVSSFVDVALLDKYDANFSIFDGLEALSNKLSELYKLEQAHSDNDDQESLSQREKEIVVCVVKGMTNKEIAEKLFLSIHTVITHRRNISKKLQIHSASGLTIYAIVNKLVSLNEVKDL